MHVNLTAPDVLCCDFFRCEWEKIGEVVSGPGGGDGDTMTPSSKLYQGVPYDYVFDVDVEDGVPPRKLPYNRCATAHGFAMLWSTRKARQTCASARAHFTHDCGTSLSIQRKSMSLPCLWPPVPVAFELRFIQACE